MINPLDNLNLSRSQKKNLDELEKLAGFSPTSKGKNKISQLAGDLVKKTESRKETNSDKEENRFWNIHKRFAESYEKNGRAFALFVGDLLDIMLSGPVQSQLVGDLIEEKITKIRKQREKASRPNERNWKKLLKSFEKNDRNRTQRVRCRAVLRVGQEA